MKSVCRVCRSENSKRRAVEKHELILIYDKLSDISFNCEDPRPRAVCYYCYQKLLQCYKFSKMVQQSERIFSQLSYALIQNSPGSESNPNLSVCKPLSINHRVSVNIKSIKPESYHLLEVPVKENIMKYEEESEIRVEVVLKEEHHFDSNNEPNDNSMNNLSSYDNSFKVSEVIVQEIKLEHDVKDENEQNTIMNSENDLQLKVKHTFKHDDIKSNSGNDLMHDKNEIDENNSRKGESKFNITNFKYENVCKQDVSMKYSENETLFSLFGCDLCSESFNLESILNTHINKYHSKDSAPKNIPRKSQQARLCDSQQKSFKCFVCDEDFQSRCHLMEHAKTKHACENAFPCSVCKKSFKLKSELREHKKIHSVKTYACPVCDKKFKSRITRYRHASVHTTEKPLTCSVCNKQFKLKTSLKIHMNIHTVCESKNFICSECDKAFYTRYKLLAHMRIHRRKKFYVCPVCGIQLCSESNLTAHLRLHTGEKPFGCSECNQQFRIKQELIVHRVIHNPGQRQMFTCTLCNKQYSSKTALVYHMKNHSIEKLFDCLLCEKQFKYKSLLVKHTRIHTGEKRFVCSICDKRFSEKCQLTLHMRTHTGERPYPCSECDKSFKERSALVKHIRTHTGEKPYACSVCDKRFAQQSAATLHKKKH